MYVCVAKCYQYRLRDEVVNERYLVEEIYDRELTWQSNMMKVLIFHTPVKIMARVQQMLIP